MKTFIRWPGNKSRYLDVISKYVPKHYNTYIEPFLGSGALFLHLQPNKWIINDINKDNIYLWRSVRYKAHDLLTNIIILLHKFDDVDDKLAFCKARTQELNTLTHSTWRSAVYITMTYLVYMGFLVVRGKYYFGSMEKNFNKPKYKPTLKNVAYKNNLLKVSDYLYKTRGKIKQVDYKDILQMAKTNDFVFLDPPYIEDHNYQFTYNTEQTVHSSFLDELLFQMKELDRKNVKWIMTQANTQSVRTLFKEYKMIRFKVYRGISHMHKYELLIKNF